MFFLFFVDSFFVSLDHLSAREIAPPRSTVEEEWQNGWFWVTRGAEKQEFLLRLICAKTQKMTKSSYP